MSTLLLWLEAPLQSWGVDSRFGRRDTLPFPTRSGILGLLCAASGRGGEQREWLQRMAGFGQTIAAYARTKGGSASTRSPNTEHANTEGVRWPLLCDFQMVGSGYDTSDPWQNMLVPKTSEGKKPVGAGTKMTYRYYLQDMAFACALEVPADEAETLARDLCAPVWELSLGRKCCAPTEVIYRGTFSDTDEALAAAATLGAEKNRVCVFRVLEGAHDEEGDVMTLNDVPVCFGIRKLYRDRQVTVAV